jgi:hypothetical protein
VSRWVRGRAGWRCELCGVKNGAPPNLLTVHHLDGNKWNLLPWNLAALCQNCHRQVQWTLDFCQSTLTDIYPEWLRQHVGAYNAWARTKGRVRTTFTSFHLFFEEDAAKLLGIPFETVMQTALIPVAYTKGVKFKPGPREPVGTLVHWDDW